MPIHPIYTLLLLQIPVITKKTKGQLLSGIPGMSKLSYDWPESIGHENMHTLRYFSDDRQSAHIRIVPVNKLLTEETFDCL